MELVICLKHPRYEIRLRLYWGLYISYIPGSDFSQLHLHGKKEHTTYNFLSLSTLLFFPLFILSFSGQVTLVCL